jgi:hypothetical protein
MLGVGLAARLIRRRWQEPTPSKAQLWLTDIFCTPAYGVGLYHRWLRWELTRNPVGWLELRRWSSRLLSWIWTAVTMSVFIFSLTAVNAGVISWRDVGIFSFLMYWLLLGCVALAAAGSFGRERASGVMELLLVTPLNERRILRGRLRGLWGQFLPAIVLLVILQHLLAFYREHQYFNLDLVRGWFLALACFMLPVIGLYYSLACRHFFSALGWTLVVGLGLPQLVNVLAKGGISLVVVGSWDGYYWAPARYFHYHPVLVFMAGGGLGLFVQLLLAVHLGRRLHRRLVQRDFVFQA